MKIKKFWQSKSPVLKSAYESRLYCGIDPGSEGSFSAIDQEGQVVETFGFKNMTERDLLEKLMHWMGGKAKGHRPMFCVIEHVHAVPGWGVSSAFKFGANYQLCRCAALFSEIPFDTVTPKKWQGKMRCRSGGDKSVTLAKAQELFPSVKMNKTGYHAVYDSLLLADYGRRVRLGLDFG